MKLAVAYLHTKVASVVQEGARVANAAIPIPSRMQETTGRMITIEHVAEVLRGAIHAADLQTSPDGLASALGLQLHGSHLARPGLHERTITFDDTAQPEVQRYQKARLVCAYALQHLGMLRWLSPHDLAVELFGVGSAPRGAQVRSLAQARMRRDSGWIASR